jgi:ribose 5-phosphate isomerase RpiB
MSDDESLDILRRWLATPFEGGRHQRRVEKIDP